MGNEKRERSFYKKQGIPAPAKNIYFYGGELYRVLQRNPTVDLIYLFHFHTGKTIAASYTDFQRKKRRAWNSYQVRKIIGRSVASWERYLIRRVIPRPKYANVGNKPAAGIRSYYSEDDLYDIRDAIAEIPAPGSQPRGRPYQRKTKVLTRQELRAKIGDGQMLYIKDPYDDDKFIPVWSESI